MKLQELYENLSTTEVLTESEEKFLEEKFLGKDKEETLKKLKRLRIKVMGRDPDNEFVSFATDGKSYQVMFFKNGKYIKTETPSSEPEVNELIKNLEEDGYVVIDKDSKLKHFFNSHRKAFGRVAIGMSVVFGILAFLLYSIGSLLATRGVVLTFVSAWSGWKFIKTADYDFQHIPVPRNT